ncbi:MAG: YegP family protein [Candidatus Sedimenticola sp. 6PFRAG7]
MPGTFELYKDAGGEFRFRFNASNGQTILSSEGYKQRSNAENGINSVKKNAAEDARYEPKETNDGRFMFNLKASNGQVVGSSRIYKTVAERDQGISMTKSDAPGAETDDLT